MRRQEIVQMIINAVVGVGLVVFGIVLPTITSLIFKLSSVAKFVKDNKLSVNMFSLLFYMIMAVGIVMILLSGCGLITYLTQKNAEQKTIA